MSTDADALQTSAAALSTQKPASISSVTHVNSYTGEEHGLPGWEPSKDMTASPVELLAKLGAGEMEHKELGGFVRNPKLVKEDIAAQKGALERFRSAIDDPERHSSAEALKGEANAQFAAERWSVALVGYLTGLWFLRRGSAPCPVLVAYAFATRRAEGADFTRDLAEVAAVLTSADYGADEAAGSSAPLRTSLLLNLAAAALKLEQWPAARAACESVLAAEPAHAKALFRLAKAHEGEGELARAIGVLASLLKQNPQNADARKLLEALRKQQAERRGAFRGMFAEPGQVV